MNTPSLSDLKRWLGYARPSFIKTKVENLAANVDRQFTKPTRMGRRYRLALTKSYYGVREGIANAWPKSEQKAKDFHYNKCMYATRHALANFEHKPNRWTAKEVAYWVSESIKLEHYDMNHAAKVLTRLQEKHPAMVDFVHKAMALDLEMIDNPQAKARFALTSANYEAKAVGKVTPALISALVNQDAVSQTGVANSQLALGYFSYIDNETPRAELLGMLSSDARKKGLKGLADGYALDAEKLRAPEKLNAAKEKLMSTPESAGAMSSFAIALANNYQLAQHKSSLELTFGNVEAAEHIASLQGEQWGYDNSKRLLLAIKTAAEIRELDELSALAGLMREVRNYALHPELYRDDYAAAIVNAEVNGIVDSGVVSTDELLAMKGVNTDEFLGAVAAKANEMGHFELAKKYAGINFDRQYAEYGAVCDQYAADPKASREALMVAVVTIEKQGLMDKRMTNDLMKMAGVRTSGFVSELVQKAEAMGEDKVAAKYVEILIDVQADEKAAKVAEAALKKAQAEAAAAKTPEPEAKKEDLPVWGSFTSAVKTVEEEKTPGRTGAMNLGDGSADMIRGLWGEKDTPAPTAEESSPKSEDNPTQTPPPIPVQEDTPKANVSGGVATGADDVDPVGTDSLPERDDAGVQQIVDGLELFSENDGVLDGNEIDQLVAGIVNLEKATQDGLEVSEGNAKIFYGVLDKHSKEMVQVFDQVCESLENAGDLKSASKYWAWSAQLDLNMAVNEGVKGEALGQKVKEAVNGVCASRYHENLDAESATDDLKNIAALAKMKPAYVYEMAYYDAQGRNSDVLKADYATNYFMAGGYKKGAKSFDEVDGQLGMLESASEILDERTVNKTIKGLLSNAGANAEHLVGGYSQKLADDPSYAFSQKVVAAYEEMANKPSLASRVGAMKKFSVRGAAVSALKGMLSKLEAGEGEVRDPRNRDESVKF